MTFRTRVYAFFAAIMLAYAPAAFAQQDLSGLPQPQQEGDITYITGGIGDEERDALHDVAGDYNLHVMSANVDGAFAGYTHLTILDRNGDELLSVDTGPIFFAQLPPGHYVIDGTHGEQERKQNITIVAGRTQHVHFGWK